MDRPFPPSPSPFPVSAQQDQDKTPPSPLTSPNHGTLTLLPGSHRLRVSGLLFSSPFSSRSSLAPLPPLLPIDRTRDRLPAGLRPGKSAPRTIRPAWRPQQYSLLLDAVVVVALAEGYFYAPGPPGSGRGPLLG